MKQWILLCGLVLATGVAGVGQQKKLEKILQDNNVSGIQLVCVRDGIEKAYNAGVIRDSSSVQITSSTVFHAASLSKSVFAYIFFRYYDRGLIDLDTPLIRYTGSYNTFNDVRTDKITARMVLRHTTGLPNWGEDNDYKLVFAPDSTFSYSGEGYVFLQRALEKITGKSLNQLASEELFGPLGMKNSSYVWDERFSKDVGFDPADPKDQRYVNKDANAAFSLLTTAEDYTLYLQALLSGKGLRESTRKIMFEKSSSADRYHISENEADPFIDWGLGYGLMNNEKGKAIWHWGDGYGGGYKCFYLGFPATKETLVFFTHSAKGLDIAPDIVDLFLGKQTAWPIKWLGYGYQHPAAMRLLKSGRKSAAIKLGLTENDLNSYGYELLGLGRKKEALAIFQLNVQLYPKSPNTYDSLGETYQALGEKSEAVLNYKKVLELNPESNNAKIHLKQLEQ